MMVKSCDDIKDILNEMKIDDCDMFKTGIIFINIFFLNLSYDMIYIE